MIKKLLLLFAKGFAMGTANIIPGVSGGTIALITGIYERLIDAIRSFDIKSVKLLFRLQFKTFADKTDLTFLATVGIGAAVGILTLARVLEQLLVDYEVYVMAVFFGLIAMSVYSVGRVIRSRSIPVLIWFILGTVVAAGIGLLSPATENASTLYVVVCGIAAICSMILPGLSGSFILIIMGNYLLILQAINALDFSILIPLAVGCIVGLVVFSRLLAYVFKRFRDVTIAAMTGFILGSLLIIWPWKEKVFMMDSTGVPMLDRHGEPLVSGFTWFFPDPSMTSTWIAIALMAAGAVTIFAIDRFGSADA